MNTSTPNRKKLVYGRQQTLDKHVARYQALGWRLRMTSMEYWANGKKSCIAELEKNDMT